jgi:ubiquinone/menaquinone biosynthesis C-methylase UbiE
VNGPEHEAHDLKDEVRRQWGNDPAGSWAAGDAELGTPLSFRRVEEDRYRVQPWMHETFRYSDWAGKRVLEIGVGLGTDHLQFARAGASVTGVDLTPQCIELTAQRFEQEGQDSDLRVMDAEHLEFPEDSFDCVYSFGALHHTPAPERAFREIRRVLRPGGAFIGALYARYSIFYAALRIERLIYREYRHETLNERLARIEKSMTGAAPPVRLFSGLELRRTLRDAGFETATLRRRHLGMPAFEGRLPDWLEYAAERLGGWYLVHDAR